MTVVHIPGADRRHNYPLEQLPFFGVGSATVLPAEQPSSDFIHDLRERRMYSGVFNADAKWLDEALAKTWERMFSFHLPTAYAEEAEDVGVLASAQPKECWSFTGNAVYVGRIRPRIVLDWADED